MLPSRVEYIKNQLSDHISLFFGSEAGELFSSRLIRFLPYAEAVRTQERVITIPYDIALPDTLEKPYKVKFNNTQVTLYNGIQRPSDEQWNAIPDESAPLWYQNRQGALIPAWNLFGNLFHLLTFGEERVSSRRDGHGRFAASFSPRLPHDLLEVPAFNEAAAVVVAGAAGLRGNGQPSFNLNGLVKPPVVVLSHDCDILSGDDIWTQAVRAVRVPLPLTKLRLPRFGNLWWILRNAVTPRKFYFDNATGMIDLERCFGYNSLFYMLNGNGGRFGARSAPESINELARKIPHGWDIGMHYNYDTFLDEDKFRAQRDQLRALVGKDVTAGRAHYLKFDPERSFAFLQKHGVLVDESSGYADMIGYRNGIAGCFRAYDTASDKALDIWEVPMTVMDAVLVRQYGNKSINKFSQLLYHLSRIGGALSVIFHPGQFYNPEHKQMLGVYHRILLECRQMRAVSQTAEMLFDRIRK